MTEKTIRNSLYLYSSREIPVRLLEVIVKHTSKYNPGYRDKEGRFGLIGVRKDKADSFNVPHEDMLDHEKCLEVGVRAIREILFDMRSRFPGMSLDEWYLFALARFRSSSHEIHHLMKKANLETWDDYKKNAKWGVRFAEKVWTDFKTSGGTIT